MGVTLETRKPIDHLSATDLSTFPVWQFALEEEGIEGRDETWVRPLNTQIVPKGEYSLQVAADFNAACGRMYGGFVGVTTADEPIEIIGGVILLDLTTYTSQVQGTSFFRKRRKRCSRG